MSGEVGARPGRLVRQLTSLDAEFLAIEDDRNHAHVSGLAVFDPSGAPEGALHLADLRNLVEERIHLLPPFRWRPAPSQPSVQVSSASQAEHPPLPFWWRCR